RQAAPRRAQEALEAAGVDRSPEGEKGLAAATEDVDRDDLPTVDGRIADRNRAAGFRLVDDARADVLRVLEVRRLCDKQRRAARGTSRPPGAATRARLRCRSGTPRGRRTPDPAGLRGAASGPAPAGRTRAGPRRGGDPFRRPLPTRG